MADREQVTAEGRYKRRRTLARLTFEDPDLQGLEVITRRISTDGLLRIVEMMDSAESLRGADESTYKPGDMGIIRDLFSAFAGVVVEWNLDDDDDQPVPPTTEGMLSQDPEFVMQLIDAWIRGISQAPPPLPGGSPSGGTSPEAALAAASQSRSPQSSRGRNS